MRSTAGRRRASGSRRRSPTARARTRSRAGRAGGRGRRSDEYRGRGGYVPGTGARSLAIRSLVYRPPKWLIFRPSRSTAERRVPALLRSAPVRASKLEPARLRAGAIQRERLLAQLAAAADTPIVLISASAGYGKSTLAAQWSARCQRPVAWVNLDRGDDDPLMFLNAVTHALDRLDPVAPELLDEFAARVPHVVDVVLPCLAAELERLSPLELIFDDLQEVTQARTLSALNFLLEVVGPGSQVVLATRTDTDLWLARQRLSGDLLEIRADQLAFDCRRGTRSRREQRRSPIRGGSRASVRTDGGVAGRDRPRVARPARARVRRGPRTDHHRRPTRDRRLPRRGDARPRAAGAPALPARDIGPAADDGAVVRRRSWRSTTRARCSRSWNARTRS